MAVALATLFTFMCAHGTLETARDALFLSRLPPQQLPWVYVAIALCGVGLAWLGTRRRAPRPGARRLSLMLAAFAAATAALAWPASTGGAAPAYLVYVWTALAATFGTLELWQLLGNRFTPEQAKRLYGPIGAGGIAGVVAGSSLAAVLSAHLPPPRLLLVGAALQIGAAVVPLLLVPGHERAVPDAPRLPAHRVLRDEPHARRLLYLVLLSSLTLTIANYLFKSQVAATVEPARLGVFFGWFYAIVNAVALVAQIALTSLVLRTLGAVRSVALLPAAMVAGGALFLSSAVSWAIVAMKAFDGVLRHSVVETAMEVLFLPLPRAARLSIKGVLEAIGQRGGQALASGGILVALGLDAGPGVLSLAVVVLAGLWLLGLVGARENYLALFKRRLQQGGLEPAPPLPDLDVPALEVLLVSLHSSDDREAIAALKILEQEGKAHLVPPLLACHPSPDLAREAMDLFVRHRRLDALPAREAAMLARARDATPGSPELLLIEWVAAHGAPDARAELARAIAARPDPRWIPALRALALSSEDGVLTWVAEAARQLACADLVPSLIDMLGRRDLRGPARAALHAIGADAVPQLLHALRDASAPLTVRRHIPRTLARIPSPEAARELVQHLTQEQDGMIRFKILRALGAMRNADADLELDTVALRAIAQQTLDRVAELLSLRVALRAAHPSPEVDASIDLLREKQRHALQRIFRLLALLLRGDFKLLHDGLASGDPKLRAASREILREAVDAELRGPLLVLVDDLDDAEKVAILLGERRPRRPDVALRRMESDRSEAVRLLARRCRREPQVEGEERRDVRA